MANSFVSVYITVLMSGLLH